jgi:subtilisin family serine protease
MRRRGLTVALLAAAATAAAATPVAAAPATGTIRLAGGDTAVAGSYIVVLKDQAASFSALAVGSRAIGLSNTYKVGVKQTFGSALNGFEASMSETQAKKVAADPGVAYVEQNHRVSLNATQTGATWGIDRIDQRTLPLSTTYTYTATAANVNAYIIDTGIRLSHTDFGGRAVSGYDAIDGGSADDCQGHGTHVAGTVGGTRYGVAKSVRLVAVRVLDCLGNGTNAGVIAGVNWVTNNAVKPAVANMSLGGGISAAVDNAVANSISKGITYAVAAGNSRANACTFSPARVPSAITVGATTRTDSRDTSYSNYGTCVDIFAPGSQITSTWRTSNTATNTISGTSMAAPHVAGAAALVLSANPSATPAQVASALIAKSQPRVTNAGSGSPNRLLYVGP